MCAFVTEFVIFKIFQNKSNNENSCEFTNFHLYAVLTGKCFILFNGKKFALTSLIFLLTFGENLAYNIQL